MVTDHSWRDAYENATARAEAMAKFEAELEEKKRKYEEEDPDGIVKVVKGLENIIRLANTSYQSQKHGNFCNFFIFLQIGF